MNWLDRLERRMGRHYIPNLMQYLCIAMAGLYVLEWIPLLQSPSELLCFSRDLILKGEIWRVITFIFLPPAGGIISVALHLYFFYFVGTALESHWGGRRFNLYYGLGVLCSILAGFITGYTTNYYLNMTLMLAFAVLYPEMQVNLFFILPVKMKWIGLAWGAYMVYLFITMGSWAYRGALLMSLAPFLLFFGRRAWELLWSDLKRLFR